MEQHEKQGERAQRDATQTLQTHQYIEAFLRCSARYLGLSRPIVQQAEKGAGNLPRAE